jgi:hypothetical protein
VGARPIGRWSQDGCARACGRDRTNARRSWRRGACAGRPQRRARESGASGRTATRTPRRAHLSPHGNAGRACGAARTQMRTTYDGWGAGAWHAHARRAFGDGLHPEHVLVGEQRRADTVGDKVLAPRVARSELDCAARVQHGAREKSSGGLSEGDPTRFRFGGAAKEDKVGARIRGYVVQIRRRRERLDRGWGRETEGGVRRFLPVVGEEADWTYEAAPGVLGQERRPHSVVGHAAVKRGLGEAVHDEVAGRHSVISRCVGVGRSVHGSVSRQFRIAEALLPFWDGLWFVVV